MEKIAYFLTSAIILVSYSTYAKVLDEKQVFFDRTSVTELIGNPEKFSRKRVSLNGYYSELGTPYLYLTPTHAQIDDNESAVSILVVDSQKDSNLFDNCAGSWVRVTGTLFPTVQKVSYRLSYRLAIDKAEKLPEHIDCFRPSKSELD